MKSIKYALSLVILVAGCSAILWPGVFASPITTEMSSTSASQAESGATDSLQELLGALGLEDADLSELAGAIAMFAGGECGELSERLQQEGQASPLTVEIGSTDSGSME